MQWAVKAIVGQGAGLVRGAGAGRAARTCRGGSWSPGLAEAAGFGSSTRAAMAAQSGRRDSSADATAFLSQVLPGGVASPIEPAIDRRREGAPSLTAAVAPPPGLARQSSGDVGDGEAEAVAAGDNQTKPRRKRKRKRKRRSSAKSDPADEDAAGSESGASVTTAGAPDAAAQLERQESSGKRRRTRNRNTTRRKPWSQMTWEEKQAVEEREAQMAAQRERERPELPMDPNGHVPRGVNPRDYRPAAPRNTTQELLKDARGRQRFGNDTPESANSDNDGRADSDGSMGDDELEDLGSGSMAAAFNARLAGHPTPAGSPQDSTLVATVKRQNQTIDRLESEVAALRAQLQVRLPDRPASPSPPATPC